MVAYLSLDLSTAQFYGDDDGDPIGRYEDGKIQSLVFGTGSGPIFRIPGFVIDWETFYKIEYTFGVGSTQTYIGAYASPDDVTDGPWANTYATLEDNGGRADYTVPTYTQIIGPGIRGWNFAVTNGYIYPLFQGTPDGYLTSIRYKTIDPPLVEPDSFEVVGPWVAPPSQETTERHQVRAQIPATQPILAQIQEDGPLDRAEYIAEIISPMYHRLEPGFWQESTSQTGWYLTTERWLMTLPEPPWVIDPDYRGTLESAQSGVHVGDWDGLSWAESVETDILAAFYVSHPTARPGSAAIEWEPPSGWVGPYSLGDAYFGTATNRVLKVRTAMSEGSYRLEVPEGDDEGNDGTSYGTLVYALEPGNLPTDDTGLDGAPDTTLWTDVPADHPYEPSLGFPGPAVGSRGQLAELSENVTYTDALDQHFIGLVPPPTDWVEIEVAISDATWASLSWPCQLASAVHDFTPTVPGMALVLVPEYAANDLDDPPYDFEHSRGDFIAAEVFLSETWTPPRYRINYELYAVPSGELKDSKAYFTG